ncbi:unnamed protein product [Candidula unifasciata]|uniref:Glutamate receptor n=1 Tax=Candidula unifasciata TaxID=100452 RepID=A0A8S3ZJS0_9EUPU|nr:unnamed protein product [Candidula unifasciata]
MMAALIFSRRSRSISATPLIATIVGVVTLATMGHCIDTLRIGVIPKWRAVVASAFDYGKWNVSIHLQDIDTGVTKTAFDKIEKTYKTISTLNVHAVIGPYDPEVSLATESLRIPYVCTTTVGRLQRFNYTVQVNPEMRHSSDAMLDVAQAYIWSKISVFYDDDVGIQVLEKLMTNHTMSVRAWRLPEKASVKDVRDSLVDMRKVLVEKCVVLCNKENIKVIMEEARNLAMLSTPPYGWIFYDPGDEIKNIFNKYNDIACNFTVITLLPYNDPFTSNGHPRLHFALSSDALQLVISSYKMILEGARGANITLSDAALRNELNRLILNNVETGMTGNLEFNSEGRRDNFSLTITAFTGSETYLRGHWYNKPYVFDKRLKFYDDKYQSNRSTPFPLKGRVAKVVMIEERPFTMKKRDHMLRKGNDRFEGFAVDLIEEVAKMLEFDYEIYLVHDGKFGSKMADGEWNGMLGELLSGNATMSVAPLSINAQREEAVDFTKPFKTRYISVLMRIPRQETSYFEFLNPLSPVVWICTLISFVVVSVILYALERMGRNKCVNSDSVQITVRESFWFIFGSLLQGNTDSTPSTIPGRILTSAWWFFALILISSYTANLAAFLTVKKINTPIKSVTDLAQQTKIKYGTVKDSGIMSFFKNTNIEHFAKMWSQMSEIDPDSMVDNTTEGYKKVKEGDYAFFWDTTVNKYQTIVDCDVMEIGPAFDPKGFGIGVPPGATYREELSMAILKLSDRGILHELETRWWDNRNCPDLTKASTDETSSLQIENVAGVFFILVGGIIIAAVVCLGEYFANAMIRASKLARGKTGNDKSSPRQISPNNGPAEKDSLM